MGAIMRRLERRDSLGNPTKWLLSAFGGGIDTATGIRVNEVMAIRNLTVMACVKVLSETIAQLPLPVYRRLPNGDRERIPDHPLYAILDRQPNPDMTAFTFREVLMAHLLTWGNAYALIMRDNGNRLLGLYPLLPDRTKPLRGDGRLQYQTRIKRDPNGTSPDDDMLVYLEADEVLHIPGLGFDGLKGYSVIQNAREAIGLGLALEEFAGRFFGNGAIPGMVFTTDKNLQPDQKKLIKTTWEEQHQGLPNAQRMAILEGGLKIEKIGIPPEDAQFIESRKFSRNEIASIYRIPPHMIGDIERATSWGTGIEQQAIGYVVYTVMPWLERWQQAIALKMLTPAEKKALFVEFLVDGLLRGDITARYNAYNLAFGKWMDADDIRRRENLPLWGPGKGDQVMVPSGMQLLAQALAPAPTEAPAPDENEPSAAAAPAHDHALARRALIEAMRPGLFDVAERIVRRERADVGRQAERGALSEDWLDAFYDDQRRYASARFLPILRSIAGAVRIQVADELGRAADGDIERFVADFAEGAAARSCAEARHALEVHAADLPVALERAFGAGSRRPERMAARESTRAVNAFARELYRAAGVPEIEWRALDEGCRPFDRRRTAPGGAFADHIGHPPAADGCACVILAAPTETQRNPRAEAA